MSGRCEAIVKTSGRQCSNSATAEVDGKQVCAIHDGHPRTITGENRPGSGSLVAAVQKLDFVPWSLHHHPKHGYRADITIASHEYATDYHGHAGAAMQALMAIVAGDS